MSRGDAAAGTWLVRRDGSRYRHGRDVDSPWSRGAAAAATRIVRGDDAATKDAERAGTSGRKIPRGLNPPVDRPAGVPDHLPLRARGPRDPRGDAQDHDGRVGARPAHRRRHRGGHDHRDLRRLGLRQDPARARALRPRPRGLAAATNGSQAPPRRRRGSSAARTRERTTRIEIARLRRGSSARNKREQEPTRNHDRARPRDRPGGRVRGRVAAPPRGAPRGLSEVVSRRRREAPRGSSEVVLPPRGAARIVQGRVAAVPRGSPVGLETL